MIRDISQLCNDYNALLIIVSKNQTLNKIMTLYQMGFRHFAENRVQNLLERKSQLPDDIHWHLIGHLQTNKVKHIAPFIYCIHSVDSLKLWAEIDKQAKLINRNISILLQVKIASEESKYGLKPNEVLDWMRLKQAQNFTNTNLIGLMGMATYTENMEQIRQEFKGLKSLFENIVNHYAPGEQFKHLSMGMSGDYIIALEEGSTMLRMGSAIFDDLNKP
jgi:pyridoxal phosphate enzyme (YggS family)